MKKFHANLTQMHAVVLDSGVNPFTIRRLWIDNKILSFICQRLAKSKTAGSGGSNYVHEIKDTLLQ